MATSNQTSLLFASDDFWAPASVMAQAQRDGVPCELIPDIPHAIGVKATKSLVVAKWLAGKLSDAKFSR